MNLSKEYVKTVFALLENGQLDDYLEQYVDSNVQWTITGTNVLSGLYTSRQDFIDRADLLSSLGYTVMVSNYLKHYKMVEYLAPIARGKLIGVILGVYNLNTIFDERYYDNLAGGLLEAFGRGFSHHMKIYVYPAFNVEDGEIYDLNNIEIANNLKGLLQYMRENDKIKPIKEFNPKLLHIMSDDVLSKIKAGASSWEEDVPESVGKAIKFYELFGYQKKEVKV